MSRLKKSNDENNFEVSLETLEKTVRELEGGALSLDDALSAYERGVGLLARCRKLLDVAERKVALVVGVDDLGEPELAPFDDQATIDRDPPA